MKPTRCFRIRRSGAITIPSVLHIMMVDLLGATADMILILKIFGLCLAVSKGGGEMRMMSLICFQKCLADFVSRAMKRSAKAKIYLLKSQSAKKILVQPGCSSMIFRMHVRSAMAAV